jgi:hypothetical protein
MNGLAKSRLLSALVAAALCLALPVRAGEGIEQNLTPAAKIDSGLGSLGHYSQWREVWLYQQPAEKIDSGLGELGHYSQWREPWVNQVSVESADAPARERARSVRQDAHAGRSVTNAH